MNSLSPQVAAPKADAASYRQIPLAPHPLGITTKVVTVSPAIAAQWLDQYQYHGQRPLDKSKAQRYARLMTEGAFRRGASAIRFARLTDSQIIYLMDGQHRLSATVQSNTIQIFEVSWIDVANEEEAAELYSAIDRGKARTLFDGLQAHGIVTRTGISRTTISLAASALKFAANSFSHSHFDPRYENADFVDGMLEVYAQPIKLYSEVTQGASKAYAKGFLRAGVMSVGILTLDAALKGAWITKAVDFWRGAAQNDGLSARDVRALLVEHLITTRITGAGRGAGKAISASESSRYVIACWNYWFDGRTIRKGSVEAQKDESGIPIRIAGTRWNGRDTAIEL